jgi:hypothetical protein
MLIPNKRESSNDFVVPRLCEGSVWTPASAGVTGFLTFYEAVNLSFRKSAQEGGETLRDSLANRIQGY